MARISKKKEIEAVRGENELAVENKYEVAVENKYEVAVEEVKESNLDKAKADVHKMIVDVKQRWDRQGLNEDEIVCILASYIKD